ncbi:hypothetical protein Pan97_12250 [Bremerella volcania]|uniref:HNH endonuclease n=1 Tax=Bremerella volcania TaxID=2527984 RepID=A0A518C4R7_9BACT|nr:HNH endonuclease [Bremerella volcania]QDU74220.1 hypothetical protein Pan97_12250 [Bremerella volcania]
MTNSTNVPSDSIFNSMNLGDDACFLCGQRAPQVKMTREHVFPRWLQNRHDLWDQELFLLNHTTIKYSKLTVPCCENCNSSHLSKLEAKIGSAVQSGYSEAVKLSSLDVYQWLGKIFYGVLRKELTLRLDRQKPDKGTIADQELLEGFSSLHLFMQSIRRPFEFPDGEPFSVLVVNLHDLDSVDYSFQDSLQTMVCSMRTKDVGFIVTLQDSGIIRNSYARYVAEVAGRKLLPIQFDELYARCLYQVSLINRIPKFITSESQDPDGSVTVNMLPLQGLSSRPIVDEWDQTAFAHILSAVLSRSHDDIKAESLFSPPNLVMTWMSDEEGKLKLVDENGKAIDV